jgi:hypothetical protein
MSERDEDYASAVYGAIIGAVIGAVLGLFVISEPPFFPDDTVLIGAEVFGILGYCFGHRFIDIVWNWLSWLP